MERSLYATLEQLLLGAAPALGPWFWQRGLSALTNAVHNGDPQAARLLALAVSTTRNDQIRERALELLGQIHDRAQIDQAMIVWAERRNHALAQLITAQGWLASEPVELTVLGALLVGERGVMSWLGDRVIQPLVHACYDRQAEISNRARAWLVGLEDPAAIDALCRWWSSSRHPFLAEVISEGELAASSPPATRVLSALLSGRSDVIASLPADHAPAMLEALDDQDPELAGRAAVALAGVHGRDTRDALCRLALQEGHESLREKVLKAGFSPSDSAEQALFHCLTGSWEAYDGLDFDGRLLHSAYLAADTATRRRLVHAARTAGRTALLTVLLAPDWSNPSASVDEEQVQTALDAFTAAKDWTSLWRLLQRLTLPQAIDGLRRLAGQDWSPRDDEVDLYRMLIGLATAEPLPDPKGMAADLPKLVRRSTASVQGRINHVAFAPQSPLLAIGTGQQKVVLWDFARGTRRRLIRGFEHSVARLAWAGPGTLLVGERSNHNWVRCPVVLVQEGEPLRTLGEHRGPVTGLLPMGGGHVISLGRDGTINVWNAFEERCVRSAQIHHTWPRAGCVSSDGSRLGLFFDGVMVLALPSLQSPGGFRWTGGVIRCGTFSPDGKRLLLGQFNGRVMTTSANAVLRSPERSTWDRHRAPVVAVKVVPNRGVALSVSADGRLRVRRWPDGQQLASIRLPGGQVTSLSISPNGDFVAIGHNDAVMSFWDLRCVDVERLLTRALAEARPGDLPPVRSLIECDDLDAKTERTLRILACLLELRFRHEIELDELPTIKIGDFDIEVE